MKSIFVTGTDTGVGKTIVTAALVSLFRQSGIGAVPMKPVQTGCSFASGTWSAPDCEWILNAAGINAIPKEREHMCPYRFERPCSPHLAAERMRKHIVMDTILRCFQELGKKNDMILVEGAGGILVPVDGTLYMRDIMSMLGLPVVLVSRPGLGTLNHTLLSINELRRAGLTVAGVIFCETEPTEDTYIVRDNKRTIARHSGVPILGTIPYNPELKQIAKSPEMFNSFCQKCLPDAVVELSSVSE